MERIEVSDDLDLRDAAKRLKDMESLRPMVWAWRVESSELDGVCERDFSDLRENHVKPEASLSPPLSLSLHLLTSWTAVDGAGPGDAAATLSDCIRSSKARSTPCGPLTLYARGEAVGVWYTADDFLRLGDIGADFGVRWTGARIRGSRYRLMVGESSGTVDVKKTSMAAHCRQLVERWTP